MSTYTQLLFQLVFSTKDRKPTLKDYNRDKLHHYFWGILKNKNCHLYRINSVDDHLHIVVSIHPSCSVSNLIKDLKVSSCKFIKENFLFPLFDGWQNGYGAFTYSIKEKNRLVEYVKNQKEHHKKISFKEELEKLLKEHEVKYDPQYLN
jgi:REP element-mobilizing transposase RayT